MADQIYSPGEQSFLTSRAPAHSVQAENAALDKEIGIDSATPVQRVQSSPSLIRDPEAQAQSAPPPPSQLDGNQNEVDSHPVKDALKAGAMAWVQAGAGVMDVASNAINSVHDIANSLDDWAQRKGVPWNDLISNNTKVDIGGYFVPAPVTQAQHVERGVGRFAAQFLGFLTGGEAAGALGIASKTGQVVAKAASGAAVAYAAFDPHEHMIGDFIRNHPDLQTPYTKFMATPEHETDAEGRFRNALEMTGMDTAIAATFAGIGKAVKGARSLMGGAKAVDAAEGAANASEAGTGAGAAPKEPPPNMPPPGAGESVSGDAKVAQENLQKLKAASPEGTAAGNFAAKADVYSTDTFAKPIDPADVEAFKSTANLGPVGLGNTGVTESLLKSGDAFDAAKGGTVTNAETAKLAFDMAVSRPEEIFNGLMTEEKVMAAGMRVRWHNELFANAEKNAINLSENLPSSHPEVEKAVATWINQNDLLKRFVGAYKGTTSQAGRLLQTATENANNIAMKTAEASVLNSDVIKNTFSSTEEALTAIKQMKTIRDQVGEKFVQAYQDRILNESGFGSVARLGQNWYMNNLLFNLSSPVVKAASDTTNAILKPLDTITTAITNKFIKTGAWVRTEGRVEELMNKDFWTMDGSGMKIQNVSPHELQTLQRFMDQKASFQRGVHEISGSLTGVWDQMCAIFDGMSHGKILGNTDASGVMFKDAIDKLSPENFDKLDNVQKASYYLSHFLNPAQKATLSLGEKAAYYLSTPLKLGKPILNEINGFFTAVGKQAELHGAAFDWAKANAESPEEFKQMFSDLKANPNEPIKRMMMESSQARTFTTPLKDGIWKGTIDALKNPDTSSLTSIANPMKTTIAPIANIGVNLTKQAIERLPGVNFLSGATRDALKMGGKEAEMVLGKMALGTGLTGMIGAWALKGNIIGEGPTNPLMKKMLDSAGIPRNSFKIPGTDKWIPFREFGVVGKLMQISADGIQLGSYAAEHGKESELQDLLLHGVAFALDTVTPDFVAHDISSWLRLMHDPSSYDSKNFATNKITSLVPFSAMTRAATKITDGVRRSTDASPNDPHPFYSKLKNDFKSMIPGLSSTLPEEPGFWGQEMHYPSHLGFGPVNVSPIAGVNDKDMSVEQEMIRLGQAGPLFKTDPLPGEEHLNVQMPKRSVQVNKTWIKLDPQQYNDLVKLSAGDMSPMVRIGAMTQKEADKAGENSVREQLKKMVNAPEWQNLNDERRKIQIAHTIGMGQKIGKMRLQSMYPELSEESIKRKQLRMQMLSAPANPESQQRPAGVPLL